MSASGSRSPHYMIDNKLTHKPDDTPILFVNFRDVEFTGYWDKKPYTFAAHESKWLPRWLANHFVKSLVDDEMNERKMPTDHSSRSSLVAKAIGEAAQNIETDEDPLGIEALNKKKQVEAQKEQPTLTTLETSKEVAKKSGRPKKVVVEEEFAGK